MEKFKFVTEKHLLLKLWLLLIILNLEIFKWVGIICHWEAMGKNFRYVNPYIIELYTYNLCLILNGRK